MALRAPILLECLNEEIKRRTLVARIFPNSAACRGWRRRRRWRSTRTGLRRRAT
ncbi:MAG: transposase [Bryobacteraceae bacterium]